MLLTNSQVQFLLYPSTAATPEASVHAERQLTAGHGIRIADIPEVQPDMGTRLRAFAEWLDHQGKNGIRVDVLEVKARVCALVDGQPYERPAGPLARPGEPQREPPELVRHVMRVLHLSRIGTLTEPATVKVLREVLDEHAPKEPVPVVVRELGCGTCGRVFCKVQAPEGAWMRAVCDGCVREGRTKER